MIDPLLTVRQHTDDEFRKASQIRDRNERSSAMGSLITVEHDTSFAYRSGLIRGKIIGLGLEESMAEIVDGMNLTASRVTPTDLKITDFATFDQLFRAHRAKNDALLQFGLEYVDRWTMYRDLFATADETMREKIFDIHQTANMWDGIWELRTTMESPQGQRIYVFSVPRLLKKGDPLEHLYHTFASDDNANDVAEGFKGSLPCIDHLGLVKKLESEGYITIGFEYTPNYALPKLDGKFDGRLTLTLDSKVDELLDGYDGFQKRVHLRTADGTTRGNVLFDENLQHVRFDNYEPAGVIVIDVFANGTVKYHFEGFAKNKRFGTDVKDHGPEVIDGSGKIQLPDLFTTIRNTAESLLSLGEPLDFALPREAYRSLVKLINNPYTRTC